MGDSLSRRQLLKVAGASAGLVVLEQFLSGCGGQGAPGAAERTSGVTQVSAALSAKMPARVIHVHSRDATFWNFGRDYYGDFVDQAAIDEMVERGVVELTGASSAAQAWQALVPDYAPGKSIAIKANFNNSFSTCDKCRTDCSDDSQLAIDALIQPINAVIRGLLEAYPGFRAQDIWVYDATIGRDPPWSARAIPKRFKDGCLYRGVRFLDQSKLYPPGLIFFKRGCNELAGYGSTDPMTRIVWRNPPHVETPPDIQVTDVLADASYVINMPIIKRHVGKGVTLAFKNHFGSIANPALLHDWTGRDSPHYGGAEYSPLVDVYRSSHILDKTVLTIGDALFGNWENNIGKPSPWSTFGNGAPNSLLFATDPVAVDCVMCDLLHAEEPIWDMADEYLVYAADCGLGTYERGNPWADRYTKIDYLRVTR